MNLHEIANQYQNMWLWARMTGVRGRWLRNNTHAWLVPPGTPPDIGEMLPWRNEPQRFHWRPFASEINELVRNGFVAPMCGWRTRSQRPRLDAAGRWDNTCVECSRIATERGLQIMLYEDAQAVHPLALQLAAERQAWRNARETETIDLDAALRRERQALRGELRHPEIQPLTLNNNETIQFITTTGTTNF